MTGSRDFLAKFNKTAADFEAMSAAEFEKGCIRKLMNALGMSFPALLSYAKDRNIGDITWDLFYEIQPEFPVRFYSERNYKAPARAKFLSSFLTQKAVSHPLIKVVREFMDSETAHYGKPLVLVVPMARFPLGLACHMQFRPFSQGSVFAIRQAEEIIWIEPFRWVAEAIELGS